MKRFMVGLILLGLVFSVVGCGKSDMPSFAETTDESVLLRYNFSKGQEALGTLDMNMTIEMQLMGQEFKVPVKMMMQFNNVVKDIDDQGVASINTIFTRIKMSMEMLGMAAIDFDSDKGKQGSSQYDAFWGLLNKKISSKVNSRGKVVDFDINSLLSGFSGGLATKALGSMKQSISQLNNSAFVTFPKDLVKKGDVFVAGVIEQDLPSVGKLETSMKYKVIAISKDKKKVILKPIAKFSLKTAKSAMLKMNIESGDFNGWLLFNLEKSSVEKSNVKMVMVFSMLQAKQKIEMKMTMDVNYKEEAK